MRFSANPLLESPAAIATLPLWALRILTFLLPVWAAWTGRLTIFEVVWVYWVEGWLVLPFLLLRIGAARGPHNALSTETAAEDAAQSQGLPPPRTATAGERLRVMAGLVIFRGGLLFFYLLFIIVFLLLQVTQESAVARGVETMRFRNLWANGVWTAFMVQHALEVVVYFFLNGAWRTASPRTFSVIFDRATVLMHVMIVSTVMLHQFVFRESDYAAKGEVAYVAMFGLLRLVFEWTAARISPQSEHTPPQLQPGPGG